MIHLEDILNTLGLENLPVEEQAELLTAIEEATLEIALDELTTKMEPEKIEELDKTIEASETMSDAAEAITILHPHFATLYENAVKAFVTELANSYTEDDGAENKS